MFDDIRELSHVAWPDVRFEHFQGAWVERFLRRPCKGGSESTQQVIR